MTDWPLLSILIFLPLVGVVFILAVRGDDAPALENIRRVALITTIFNFVLSLGLWFAFDPTDGGMQFVEKADWIPGLISYHLGVDGISMPFVVLTAFLMPFCILASWKAITDRVREYMVAFLILEMLMIGVFCALDIVIFYIFFEGGLIPMFIIIGVWGGPRKIYASFKFFLYTLTGSLLMLLAIIAMYWDAGTTSIPDLMLHDFPAGMQTWLWLAFFASFAVKMPMWPVHTWLPDAHVEAPTAGSVLLAGILLKMGGYGFLRFSLPMFPIASAELAWLVFTLSCIAIIVTSLTALVQKDMKKLIAYSSVAHMGFVTMGIFAMNTQGIQGAVYLMLSHGIVSAALFLCVGVVYDRAHTREISAYGGLIQRMPLYATAFMVFTMANVGLPGTSGFVGEFLAMIGTYKTSVVTAVVATTGVILSAAYALYLYRRVVLGPLEKESMRRMLDLDLREKFIMVPLVFLTILFGVWPNPVLNVTEASINELVGHVAEANGAPAGPKIDASQFTLATGSSADAVARGLEAAGMATEGGGHGEAETHGTADAHGEAGDHGEEGAAEGHGAATSETHETEASE
ncbi:NADH-quinone oxidoreductase subunit M [Acuticoccus sp. I52.16.1]|uniref:NADH-quinone oxidoreductase subunit M n=1 Tax=Acuticoccus sp. I52.16.1 TaxID=2928472 RepID=UPI001FD4301C|nr:NADH-quinone oxidoreductase subunit M [Acuticoccus sp. I52.16.1]UOM34214.1 NADH-quinone oxidoreductase subunit M [Acuticoccus sp. I52.16.1]